MLVFQVLLCVKHMGMRLDKNWHFANLFIRQWPKNNTKILMFFCLSSHCFLPFLILVFLCHNLRFSCSFVLSFVYVSFSFSLALSSPIFLLCSASFFIQAASITIIRSKILQLINNFINISVLHPNLEIYYRRRIRQI